MSLLAEHYLFEWFDSLPLKRGLRGEGQQPTGAAPMREYPHPVVLYPDRIEVKLVLP